METEAFGYERLITIDKIDKNLLISALIEILY